jgi:hypothetical protein
MGLEGISYRRAFLRYLAITVLVLGMALWSPAAQAAPQTISTFQGDIDEVNLTFREANQNGTADIEIPRGATILTAEMDLEGIQRHGDDTRSYDFSNYNPTTPTYRAWQGMIPGNYPPSYPYWNPYSPHGTAFTVTEYGKVASSNDDRLQTNTGTLRAARYPFQLFRIALPVGTVTNLGIEWEGYGYCSANSSTNGAEVFLWSNSSQVWDKAASYTRSEAAQDRLLEKSYRTDPGRYIDGDRQVFALVYGKMSQNTAPPNPSTENGELNTDYVRLNVTFEGGFEYVTNVSLSVDVAGQIWFHRDNLEGQVHIGESQDLDGALQQAVDAAEIIPGNMTVGLSVRVSRTTAGVVRLSNLSITYEPLVNNAPRWGSFGALSMDEDTDAIKLLDLDTVASDDHSGGKLRYRVEWASTTAIEARVEEKHYLSFYVKETHWFGTASFRVNATDAWGEVTTSPVFDVAVVEVNDPPSLDISGQAPIYEDEVFEYTVPVTDPDGDSVTFFDNTDMFDIDPSTGIINFTPSNDDVGLHEINITVLDARGASSTSVLTLRILNSNDDPTIDDPGTLEGVQGEPFYHNFSADDPDLIHGDSLRWYILGDEFYRTNLLIDTTTGELTWINIGNSDVGDHSFQVQVTDAADGEDRLDVKLVIENVNDPPSFAFITDQTVMEDEELHLSLIILEPDLDLDPMERLTWTVEPAWFSVGTTGTIIFVPSKEHVGNTTITVSVTDRAGESYSQSFLMTVIGINHPPIVEPMSDQTLLEDEPWSFDLVVSDIDPGDVVHISASAPFGVPATGGTIRWTPKQRHVGDHIVIIEATDSGGAKTVMTFNITVLLHDDAPTVIIIQPKNDTVFASDDTINLQAFIEDEEGRHLTILWKWRYRGTTEEYRDITSGDAGVWTTTPSGKLEVIVEVDDGVNYVTSEVTIEVEGEPDEGGIGAGLIAAIAVIAVLVVLLVIFLMRRRQPAPIPPETKPKEQIWEAYDEHEPPPTSPPRVGDKPPKDEWEEVY